MKVCYFGTYNSKYSRNKILISGLQKNNVEVFECQTNKIGFLKYFDLIKKHRTLKGKYDVMVVGYPGFQSVLLAKLITSKPIVFDAFVSMYDSMVFDRAEVARYSIRALYLWLLDKISMTVADVVLFDTNEHIDFASKKFGINKNKFKRIFVGADTSIFYPREKEESEVFRVFNYGHYVPLQGMDCIVSSAKLLEKETDIVFDIVGGGKGKKDVLEMVKKDNIKNVNFFDNLSLEDLAQKMSTADICLGIFGKTDKAKRVIPNKVYEAIAECKPVITGDSRAVRELFGENEIFFTKMSSPESLAETILMVKSDKVQADVVAKNGYEKFQKNASVDILGGEFVGILKSLVNRNEI